jgi:hypothetical protein
MAGDGELACSLPLRAFNSPHLASSITDLWGNRWHAFLVSALLAVQLYSARNNKQDHSTHALCRAWMLWSFVVNCPRLCHEAALVAVLHP